MILWYFSLLSTQDSTFIANLSTSESTGLFKALVNTGLSGTLENTGFCTASGNTELVASDNRGLSTNVKLN